MKKVPAEQLEQLLVTLPPVLVRNVPAMQGVHEAWPASTWM